MQQPMWSPDSSQLLYLRGDNRTLMRVPLQYEPTFSAGQSEPLLELPTGAADIRSIDNERFLLVVPRGGTWNFAVVTNWVAGLESD